MGIKMWERSNLYEIDFEVPCDCSKVYKDRYIKFNDNTMF